MLFRLLVFIVMLSAPAFADCTLSGTAVCDGVSCAGETRPEGHILYNADNTVMQYCAGTEWKEANLMPACSPGDTLLYTSSGWSCSSGGCPAPSSCSTVGNTCADGSIFAGFMLYGTSCEALFVTDADQSTSSQWKNATGTDDVSMD